MHKFYRYAEMLGKLPFLAYSRRDKRVKPRARNGVRDRPYGRPPLKLVPGQKRGVDGIERVSLAVPKLVRKADRALVRALQPRGVYSDKARVPELCRDRARRRQGIFVNASPAPLRELGQLFFKCQGRYPPFV